MVGERLLRTRISSIVILYTAEEGAQFIFSLDIVSLNGSDDSGLILGELPRISCILLL